MLKNRVMKRTLIAILFILVIGFEAEAGTATWRIDPTSGNWNLAANWNPMTIPNGPTDVASFEQSSTTEISISGNTQVSSIVFNSGASAFTISTGLNKLVLSGPGVINNSGVTQNFVVSNGPGLINFIHSADAGDATYSQAVNTSSSAITQFSDTASAGNATFINEGGSGVFFINSSTAANGTFYNHAGGGNGGATDFFDTSNAGNGTFICDGGSPSAPTQGFMYFLDSSSAANATLIANGASASDLSVGNVTFYELSTAGNAIITANGGTAPRAGGARIYFGYIDGSPSAANATIIANDGTNGGRPAVILFDADSTGDEARIELNKGKLNLTTHNPPGVSIGSIEGNGVVLLGANNLTVGANNLSTNFSGTIKDGDYGGSLTKIGSGRLILGAPSTYSGDSDQWWCSFS